MRHDERDLRCQNTIALFGRQQNRKGKKWQAFNEDSLDKLKNGSLASIFHRVDGAARSTSPLTPGVDSVVGV